MGPIDSTNTVSLEHFTKNTRETETRTLEDWRKMKPIEYQTKKKKIERNLNGVMTCTLESEWSLERIVKANQLESGNTKGKRESVELSPVRSDCRGYLPTKGDEHVGSELGTSLMSHREREERRKAISCHSIFFRSLFARALCKCFEMVPPLQKKRRRSSEGKSHKCRRKLNRHKWREFGVRPTRRKMIDA